MFPLDDSWYFSSIVSPYPKVILWASASTWANTPKGMMQRGVAWPTLRLHSMGSDGSPTTSTSARRYSASKASSMGLPAKMPQTESKTPAPFRYRSARRYFSGDGFSSLLSSSSILPRQPSAVGNSPYFRQRTGISA